MQSNSIQSSLETKMHFSLKGRNMQSVTHKFFELIIWYFWQGQFLLSYEQSNIRDQLPLSLILRSHFDLTGIAIDMVKAKDCLFVFLVVKCCCFGHCCCVVTWSCFPSRPSTCEESKQTPFGHAAARLKFQIKIYLRNFRIQNLHKTKSTVTWIKYNLVFCL